MINPIAAVDISEHRLTKSNIQTLKVLGYEMLIQCLWTGGFERNARINLVAEPNMELAATEGLAIAGYSNASPWFESERSLTHTMLNAGQMWNHIQICATDIELHEPPHSPITEGKVLSHMGLTEQLSKKTTVYSARWFWQLIGNPQWSWIKRFGLWNAFYDYDQDIDFPSNPYGPWEDTDIVGEQFSNRGSETLGFESDLNVLSRDWWLPTPIPQKEEVNTMSLLIREEGRNEVYEVSGGKLFHVPDLDTLNAMTALGVGIALVKSDNPLLKLPVEYHGIPAQLRV